MAEVESFEDADGVEEVEGVVVMDGEEVHGRGPGLPPGWSVRWMTNSQSGLEYKRYHGPDAAGVWVKQAQSPADAWRKFEAARGVGATRSAPDPKPDPKRKKRSGGGAEAEAGAGAGAGARAAKGDSGEREGLDPNVRGDPEVS